MSLGGCIRAVATTRQRRISRPRNLLSRYDTNDTRETGMDSSTLVHQAGSMVPSTVQ